MTSSAKLTKVGDAAFAKTEKINSELFVLTYGAIVNQLLKESNDDVATVNKELEQMGYNIGLRLIEEFLARSGLGRCRDLRETAEVIGKVGFKMFLGVTAQVTNFDESSKTFCLGIDENPLLDFVELPEKYKGLLYTNLLCGVIRGALEMVQMRVETSVLKCALRGDDQSLLKVVFIEHISDSIPAGEED